MQMQHIWWVFLLISILELGIIIWLWLKNKNDTNLSDNENIVRLMKIYRHDWLNHIQVILGYVSMKKCEKIKEYIDRVYETVKQESDISNFKDKDLAAFLYLLPVHYPKLDIQLEVEENINETMKMANGKWILSYLKAFIDLLAFSQENQDQIYPLYLTITHNTHDIMVTIEYEGDVSSVIFKINQLGERLTEEKGYFSIDLHTINELIMDIHFPSNELTIRGSQHL